MERYRVCKGALVPASNIQRMAHVILCLLLVVALHQGLIRPPWLPANLHESGRGIWLFCFWDFQSTALDSICYHLGGLVVVGLHPDRHVRILEIRRDIWLRQGCAIALLDIDIRNILKMELAKLDSIVRESNINQYKNKIWDSIVANIIEHLENL